MSQRIFASGWKPTLRRRRKRRMRRIRSGRRKNPRVFISAASISVSVQDIRRYLSGSESQMANAAGVICSTNEQTESSDDAGSCTAYIGHPRHVVPCRLGLLEVENGSKLGTPHTSQSPGQG